MILVVNLKILSNLNNYCFLILFVLHINLSNRCYSLPVIENRSSLIHEDVAAHNYKHVNQLISNKLASPTNETQTQTQNQMQLQMMNEYHITQLSKDLLASQRSLPKFEMPKNFNVSQIESNLKRFGVNSLELDKHVEGLPLELDGKVNKDFHREIFLGNHELFENEMMNNEDVRKRKLTQIFRTADTDDDNKLSKKELQNWVLKNIETHTNEARDKNSRLFLLIDANKDGKVTWHEYYALYIKFHGINSTDIKELDNLEFIHNTVTDNFKRELVKIRYRWTDADVGNDNELDIDEFLAFRHPEIAGHAFKHIVDDLILQMDRDGDGKLVEKEFAFLPSNVVLEDEGNKEWADMDRKWLEEQKREFQEMDEDKNGIVTKEELQHFMDPMNKIHINSQINKLFGKVDDTPKDEHLSLDEIQNHADVFADMKLLDTERALHDEF